MGELRDVLVIFHVFALCLLFCPKFVGLFIHREMGASSWIYPEFLAKFYKLDKNPREFGMPHLQRTHLFQISTGTAGPAASVRTAAANTLSSTEIAKTLSTRSWKTVRSVWDQPHQGPSCSLLVLMGISTNQKRIYFFCRVSKIGNVIIRNIWSRSLWKSPLEIMGHLWVISKHMFGVRSHIVDFISQTIYIYT